MIPHLDVFIVLTEVEAWAIICALVLMLFDVISGLSSALVRHDFQSAKMREGLGHKAMLILVIALAVVLQGFATHVADLGISVPLITPVCVYIALMEVASVLENVSKAYPALSESGIMRLFGSSKEE